MNEIDKLKEQGYYIAQVDSTKCSTFDKMLNEIANAFKFPDYYSGNLNSFKECINDLDWIEEQNYALVYLNSDMLLMNDLEKKIFLNEFIDSIKKEWENVPNFSGEENFRKRSDFKVIYL